MRLPASTALDDAAPRRQRSAAARLCLLAVLLATSGNATRASDDAELSAEHQAWLETVGALITDAEREFFLGLGEPYQREAFIQRFWEVRDHDPRTRLNELRVNWEARADEARVEFGDLSDARAVALMFNGPPGRFQLIDGRVVSRCFHREQELEIWFYGGSARTARHFVLILRRPAFRRGYELWRPGFPLEGYRRSQLPTTEIAKLCDELLPFALNWISEETSYEQLLDEVMSAPPPPSEWLSTFASFSTDLPPNTSTFDVELELTFPGRKQSRTAVQGIIVVPYAELASAETEGSSRHLLVTGEVVRDGKLFEGFRYRFEVEPVAAGDSAGVPLVFQRYLRPGPARLILRVEDLLSGRQARIERTLEVPARPDQGFTLTEEEAKLLALYAEANRAVAGARSIRILPPLGAEIQVGAVRFNTAVSGDVAKVTFLLDDKPVLTKRRPPYSVELNLGSVASTHVLRVEAYDEHGVEVASDELLVNQGGQRFRVRLVEPRTDKRYEQSLVAIAGVEVPDGATLDRVELFLNERRLATLYQEPFEQPLLLPGHGLAYVRAVAYLTDGNTTEDVVFVNSPDLLERVEVQYVELYASVVDGQGRPLRGLQPSAFAVFEDGVRQEMRRFEWVESLPIHAALLIDTSASMAESLAEVTAAAQSFAEQAIQPRDRLTLISFAHRPQVELRFTSDTAELATALGRLKAEGGTALYDSLVFALNYFHGIKGQKALLLLSDGQDEASRFDFNATLEIARRAGVILYPVALKQAASDRGARKVLRELAAETGGQAFFITHPAELPAIYTAIEEELRSQYLIAYQSTSVKEPAAFRGVEVKLLERGGEVRTMSGYYP